MADWALRSATSDDVQIARTMLAVEGLPTEDVNSDNLAFVAEVAGEVAGMIGLERFAGRGLLRSLVVGGQFRSLGLGNELVAALEAQALRDGLKELWLLTIDADRWFAGLGYAGQDRDKAPQEIRKTKEFASLCPGDAVLMKKVLGP